MSQTSHDSAELAQDKFVFSIVRPGETAPKSYLDDADCKQLRMVIGGRTYAECWDAVRAAAAAEYPGCEVRPWYVITHESKARLLWQP